MTDIVAALVRRHSELAGEANAIRTRLATIGSDLSHLNAVIRQFDPEHDLAAIRPKRPRRADAARPGEMSRYLLGVLREAPGPMTTVEVAQRFMADRGIDVSDRKAVRLATKRVGMTLRHQRVGGRVRSQPGPGLMVSWTNTKGRVRPPRSRATTTD